MARKKRVARRPMTLADLEQTVRDLDTWARRMSTTNEKWLKGAQAWMWAPNRNPQCKPGGSVERKTDPPPTPPGYPPTH